MHAAFGRKSSGCYLTETYPGKLFTLNVLGVFPVYLLYFSLFTQSLRDKGKKGKVLKSPLNDFVQNNPLGF